MGNKIWKTIYYLFIAFIVLVVLLLISSFLPIPGGIKTYVVQSGSMEPDIKTGSVVIVKPVGEYKVGDVITFGSTLRGKMPTTHRITEIKNGSYTTKGDANNTADMKSVAKREIIGKVMIDIPYVGYIVTTAKQPIGFAVLVIVPALIIVSDEIKKIWGEVKKMKMKKEVREDN